MTQQMPDHHKEAQDFIHSFERFKHVLFLTNCDLKDSFVTRWTAYYKDAEAWVYIDVMKEATGLRAKYRFEDEDQWRELK